MVVSVPPDDPGPDRRGSAGGGAGSGRVRPLERSDYTYARHVDWIRQALLDELDLQHMTFFGQDWGGLVGLRLVAENPDRFARVVVANTGLPTGDQPMSDAFLAWQGYSQDTPELAVGRIVSGGCASPLAPEIVAAYDAQFPDDSSWPGAGVPDVGADPAGRPGGGRE